MYNNIHLVIKGRILIGYWLRWQLRDMIKPFYGVIGKQTDDWKGVILPNGRYIPYGKKYYRAYFAGRIL